MFGGTLLTQICEGILTNESIVSLFTNLYDADEFTPDPISESMKYYIKVFGNVRAKELCYRYNSNLTVGPEQGLRQNLCSNTGKGKKKQKKGSKKKKQVVE